MLQARNTTGTAPAATRLEGDLVARYAAIRDGTLTLCDGLTAEDCQVQSMADASPVKWHLAHTTWFFETFVLTAQPGYVPPNPAYALLFNSYYNSLGTPPPRERRGLMTRPTLHEVRAYRARVDQAVTRMIEGGIEPKIRERIELGLQHEQQHQELILTDVKHAFSLNPQQPAYRPGGLPMHTPALPARWLERPGVMVEIGHTGRAFAFDNERPRHRVWLDPYALASRCVTNGEYLEFIRDGGYTTPTLWLADGWERVRTEGWTRPLYWSPDLEQIYTLRGPRPLDPHEPVCHLSFYEADAYARWAGARLPREEEWEAAAAAWPVAGNFVESEALHPRNVDDGTPGFFGNVWEWTASPYVGYPGYRPLEGSLGEYNAKFMCNQFVLRGGSCASSVNQLRATYRNFFPPHARWQFSGLRLAKDLT